MDLKSFFKKNYLSESTDNVLFTYIQKDKLFLNQYKNYKPDLEKVKKINTKLQNGKMIVVSAYWCPDCKN